MKIMSTPKILFKGGYLFKIKIHLWSEVRRCPKVFCQEEIDEAGLGSGIYGNSGEQEPKPILGISRGSINGGHRKWRADQLARLGFVRDPNQSSGS
ncbi:hypothetical protein NQ315_013703 [Exocentrus adspersus]|uniref:Uncharacterized protein n=1 Tax=Exocentrus adspersus TaxID=1586481 RepID=A0AAV8W554_9CUCU|nr:hypothetical protein NQ315_013703 [Exocentrus adspersus]